MIMREQPAVGVVIPIYKHAGLVPETIRSALHQVTDFAYVIILVNDGCPFPETDLVCRQYAGGHLDNVLYIRKPNGGLSSARNAGIALALKAFPSIEAVYLMDADNRIGPYVLQKCLDLLRSAPEEVGWAYPDIDKFGIEEFCDVSGAYKPLEHLIMNICEAGSMVRRRVLDAGVRFDERMRKGYEDWEFWLQCLSAGYRGVHAPAIGFRYRQRGESMVKDSERHHAEILGYMQTKHQALFAPQQVMRLEQETLKRYAIALPGGQEFLYTTDPGRLEERVGYRAFADAYLRHEVTPELGAVPGYLVCTSPPYLELLTGLGLTHGLFWQMQQCLDQANLVALYVECVPGVVTEIDIEWADTRPGLDPALVLRRTELLRECMRDATTDWIASTQTASPMPRLTHLRVRIAAPYEAPNAVNATEILLALVHQMRGDYRLAHVPETRRTYIQEQRYWFSRPDAFCEKMYGARHVLPVMPSPDPDAPDYHVGFLLPLAEFGGVEKVAFNYASVLKDAGCRVHLFLICRSRALIPAPFEGMFSTITFFEDEALGSYMGALEDGGDYLGCGVPQWNKRGKVESAIGMLTPMQAVINCQVPAFNTIMAPLRKLGINTFSSQHLVDLSWIQQPIGSPHQFLAYEHAYDGVLCISRQLMARFRGLGVPAQKLLYVPNAASYPVEARAVERIMGQRQQRPESAGLRVLYIGRFDRQKGLDRLAALIEAATGRRYARRMAGRGQARTGRRGPAPGACESLSAPARHHAR
jgi:glycosyltransferase involved in cell wall biosynthesis